MPREEMSLPGPEQLSLEPFTCICLKKAGKNFMIFWPMILTSTGRYLPKKSRNWKSPKTRKKRLMLKLI